MRYLLSLILLLLSLSAGAQETIIRLSNDKPEVGTSGFIIIGVTDARSDTTKIGSLRSAGSKQREPANLDGGVATALLSYLTTNIPQDANGTPVELVILKLEVTEKGKKGSSIAHIAMSYGFRIAGEQHLVLSAEVESHSSPEAIGKAIGKQLARSTAQFNKWFGENKDKILAKPGITVTVTVSRTAKDKNIVMYTKKRKLTYGDFLRRPPGRSKYAAETASGIYLEGSGLTINKQIYLKLKIGSAFHKKSSWFKKNSRNRYVLDHEQLHFDITAYGTCEFIKAVRAYPFTPENHESELNKLQRQYNDLIGKMQDEYDTQTEHGLVKEKQAEWRAKINEMLLSQACYE